MSEGENGAIIESKEINTTDIPAVKPNQEEDATIPSGNEPTNMIPHEAGQLSSVVPVRNKKEKGF